MSSSLLRPSQPDLRVAVPNHLAGSARWSGGGHGVCQHAVLVPSAPVPGRSGPRRSADSDSPLGGGPGARVCVCWEGGPPRGRPCASASPSPGAHGRPRPRRRPEPPPSSLAFASRVSCRPPSPGRAPGAAAEQLPAGERLRARTGAGGGGLVRGGRAGERRARRRRPPSRRSLSRSPPPALRSLPPLPGVIDPSRAPPLPPPLRPF